MKLNRGRVRLSGNMLKSSIGFPLPQHTKIVDIVSFRSTGKFSFFDLIVESPDIDPPAADGSLPAVNPVCLIHSVPKDRMVPHLGMVEYIAVSSWEGKPGTRKAVHWPPTKSLSSERAEALLNTALDDGALHSPAFEAMRELELAKPLVDISEFGSWADVVATLNEDQVRKLCAVMLQSFWGGDTKKPAA